MPLFKKQLARPKWIKDKEKKKWWEMKYPEKGISRTNQLESTFESDNSGVGAIVSILFSALVFGLMLGLVFLFNWIGENFL
ncbi:MAG: hypothetical protein ABJH98_01125 [Reichenbachiella sp.]|uniref:hypothetical protein n=1 Tax=Reichenbachiella sp. TaxID=2184521 RepID=UPI003296D0DE